MSQTEIVPWIISWCPGAKCDPCAPLPTDKVPAVLRGSVSAMDPDSVLIYYNGESFNIAITLTVQDFSASFNFVAGPYYGYARVGAGGPIPDTPCLLDPIKSWAVTATSAGRITFNEVFAYAA